MTAAALDGREAEKDKPMLKKMDTDKTDLEDKNKNKGDKVFEKKAKKARSNTEAGDLNAGSVGRKRKLPSCN